MATRLTQQGRWSKNEGKALFTQVLSYQRHVKSLKKIKPGIKIDAPWKPSFSLSKRLNKYHKCMTCINLVVENEITKQNQNLLSRMLKI